MDDLEKPQKPQKFLCENCNFITSNKKDYSRHLMTLKHKKEMNGLVLDDDFTPKKPQTYLCDCGKEYKYNQGLWKHKQNCNKQKNTINENKDDKIEILTNLILDVVKQNTELTNKIVDMSKSGQINNINNGTINNNKTFNLNVYLNETCKNAMNLTDFIDSLQLQLSDLEHIGKVGFIEGISNIIVKKLNSLDETERPVHCTDRKRESVYIKDENKWKKEDENKTGLRKVIKKVAFKNEKLLPKFKETYPDYNDSDSKRSDQYSKIVIEAMGGNTDEPTKDKEDKIIKKIVKEVTINKSLASIENID